MSPSASRAVQACITNVSFPQELEGLRQMVRKNRGIGPELTDLDVLISFPSLPNMWTAPRWMTSGDLLFFYHAATAPHRIRRLRRELEQQGPLVQPDDATLAMVLARAAAQAQTRAGKLFAVAEISGRPAYERLEHDERHFRGRIFAPFEEAHHLEQPVAIGTLAEIGISINRQSALTPVEGEPFTQLKARLAQANRLPAFVANAQPGGVGFRGVNASTWRAISCAAERRFIHEGQLRSYLTDYLLDEIKDPRTPRLEECDCFRATAPIGRADYMIMLAGHWVPVEAKLNIEAERDLPGQLAQYIQIDSFIPRRGQWRGERVLTPRADQCLVIDQLGLYVTRGGTFPHSDRPLLRRDELGRLTGAEVRSRLVAMLH